MIKGSEKRHADHPVQPLILDRWSPRAMSGAELPEADLMSLFEAARWAPSSYNNQPWRILYARRGTPQWVLFFELLAEPNRAWCSQAAVLVLFISKTTFDHNEKPCRTHSYDCGAAWENMALEGTARGLVVHGMQGFDYEKARTSLAIPEVFAIEAMAAIGRVGETTSLPPEAQERELPSSRRPLSETICEGPWRKL